MCKAQRPAAPQIAAGPAAATAQRPDRSWLISEARMRIQRGTGGRGRKTVATALDGLPDSPDLAAKSLASVGDKRNPRTPTILGR